MSTDVQSHAPDEAGVTPPEPQPPADVTPPSDAPPPSDSASTSEPPADAPTSTDAQLPVYTKEFVLLGRCATVPGSGDDWHTAHAAATVHEAIQRGLHPRGDVSYDGATDHADGRSVTLAYSVAYVRASVDHAAGETTTPSSVLTRGTGGS